MNLLDLVVVVFVIVLAARGYRRGLVREACEAASTLGALAVAQRMQSPMAASVSLYSGIPQEVTRPVLFVAIALVVAGVGYAVAPWLQDRVPRQGMWGRVDDLGGFGFGLLKGVFFISLLLVVAGQVPIGSVTTLLDGSMFSRSLFTVLPSAFQALGGWIDVQQGGS